MARPTLLAVLSLPALAALALAVSAGGCVSEPAAFVPGDESPAGSGGSGGGGGGGEAGAPVENHGAEMFAELEDDFAQSCDVGCHGAGGIANTPFLALPDRYASVTSWPGIVRVDWAESSLLTHAKTGAGHTGPNLDAGDLATSLLPRLEAWLEEEAKGIVDPINDTPALEPFAPIEGFNSVYLDALDPDLAGQSLTFFAELVTPTTLKLSMLQAHPTGTLGLHAVHPLFVVFPVGEEPDPDPIDSFSNLELYVEPAIATSVGPGTLLLTNWQDGAKVSIAFELIEGYEGDPNNPGGGCLALDEFIASAAPAFDQNCVGCHGNPGSQAGSAVDMSALDTDPAVACAQIKNRVNLGDPPASQIFITTDPGGNAAHPYKFNGNAGSFDTFRSDVTVWITAEAAAQAME